MNATKPEREPLACSLEEAGRLLGVGRTTAFRMANSGQLPTVLVMGRRKVAIKTLERFLEGTPSAR